MTHFSILCTVKACILFQWPLELLFWRVLFSLGLETTHLFYPLLPHNKFITFKMWGRIASMLMYRSLLVKEYFAQYSLYSSISMLLPPSAAMKKLLPCLTRRVMMASTLLVTAMWCIKGICIESFICAAVRAQLSEWSSELMNEHSYLKQTYISFKLYSFISMAYLSSLAQSKVNP